MIYILPFIAIGFLPSLVWMLFYLRKDKDPESNLTILKVFIYGIFFAVPVYFIQSFLNREFLSLFLNRPFLFSFLNLFIVIALIEEIFKYIPFRIGAQKNHELDEPVDVVLYMIIAGLGFAAAENILFFLSEYPNLLGVAFFSLIRFISGTFFHALVCGTFGYFIALSFYKTNMRKRLFFSGLIIATILHGLYNLFIIENVGYLRIISPLLIIIILSIFISFIAFPHLKKMKSVCSVLKK